MTTSEAPAFYTGITSTTYNIDPESTEVDPRVAIWQAAVAKNPDLAESYQPGIDAAIKATQTHYGALLLVEPPVNPRDLIIGLHSVTDYLGTQEVTVNETVLGDHQESIVMLSAPSEGTRLRAVGTTLIRAFNDARQQRLSAPTTKANLDDAAQIIFRSM